jgi:hypothetical protein
MAQTLKLGKGPAVRPHVLSDLAAYTTKKIPDPPSSVDYYSSIGRTDWGMLGNDQYGDCTIAGAAHAVMAWNSEAKMSDPVPGSDQVLAQYNQITGGKDTGCVESDVLTLWRKHGLFGDNQIDGFAPVDPKNLVEIHQAIAFYGGAYIGVRLPQSAMEQFNKGQPWTVVQGSPIEGGHCVHLVGYDSTYVYAVTWGQVVQVAYPWLATYIDECWAIISQEFVKVHGGPLLDLATLQADISKI